jgi:ABC-type oligopeptide transport system substrate-binding subunit
MEAKEETDDIGLRYAKMAVAEAKLLESGVLIPNNTSGGSYAIGRVAPGSTASVKWGDDQYRYVNAIVTTELITAEDRLEMKEKLEELKGTGTYTEWAKNYLEEKGYTLKDSVNTNLYGTDPTTWDILSSAQTVNAYPLVQTFSGLYQYDVEDVLQPELAESYEMSDDGLTYTFHLREGLSWVDSQGRKVADLKADDFVAGMQHMMDYNDDSGLGDLLRDIIVNVNEYLDGEITDFSQVGVSAPDDLTVVYTLESPCPYFMTMLSYTPFAPMSRDYFTSQGGKFGQEFDSSASDYTYGKTPDNIAYCGPFIITNYTSKNVIAFKQNESYWNKDNVQITSMTWPYEDQSDPTKMYNDIKSGTLDASALNTSEVETAKADGIFDDYAYITSTTGSTFSIYFNLNRAAYANVNDETKVVSSLEEEDKDRTNTALNNANFRLAVAFSVDKATRQAQRVGESLKLTRIRNSYTPGTFVTLPNDVTIDINGTETTFPEGTYFGEIVQAQLDADNIPILAFDETADDGIGSSDGYDGYYNVDNAKEFLEKAIEELAQQGIVVDEENPIKLEIPYSSATEWVVNTANALKQSVEGALDGKVEIVLAEATDSTDWYYAGYYTTYGYEANYNITDVSGWGPDYGDPSTYLDTFLPDYAGYVVRSLGIF